MYYLVVGITQERRGRYPYGDGVARNVPLPRLRLWPLLGASIGPAALLCVIVHTVPYTQSWTEHWRMHASTLRRLRCQQLLSWAAVVITIIID